MDRNSAIGLALISAIIIGWFYWTMPTKEEIKKRQIQQDSIAALEQQKIVEQQIQAQNKSVQSSAIIADSTFALSDSAKQEVIKQQYGVFGSSAVGENKKIFIENELIKATIDTKGGRISSVELKNYKRHDQTPLVLFNADSSFQTLQFIANSKGFTTDSLYFTTTSKSFFVKETDSNSLALRLYAGSNDKYIEYLYSLKGNSYLINYKINLVGMQDVIAANTSDVLLKWGQNAPSQESDLKNQRAASTIYYKYAEDETDYLSETEDEKKSLDAKLKWVAFKQQFFTSVLIAESSFEKPTDIEIKTNLGSTQYVKSYTADLTIPYNHQAKESFDMKFYFGPNHYKTLANYDLSLEKQVPLGWGIFGWVNRFLVIPIFNFLQGFNLNYGIIILILTIVIKAFLFPIAYKTYLGAAKMKILKPEMDEINKKYGMNDAMKKQQAIMDLYRKSGVNPLAGCIPVLLQMPILIALFRFFPASIELRQQAFLWAKDLSTYDSIWNFGYVPIINSIYGDHVSLFTLLMTISTILYTYTNSSLMGTETNPQMPNMKWMMYAFPFIFMGVFNNYSAGLSYYYFLANMITFGQTFLMKSFVDENALRLKIEENKKKPAKVSSFQKRLEQMAKERQNQLKKRK